MARSVLDARPELKAHDQLVFLVTVEAQRTWTDVPQLPSHAAAALGGGRLRGGGGGLMGVPLTASASYPPSGWSHLSQQQQRPGYLPGAGDPYAWLPPHLRPPPPPPPPQQQHEQPSQYDWKVEDLQRRGAFVPADGLQSVADALRSQQTEELVARLAGRASRPYAEDLGTGAPGWNARLAEAGVFDWRGAVQPPLGGVFSAAGPPPLYGSALGGSGYYGGGAFPPGLLLEPPSSTYYW